MGSIEDDTPEALDEVLRRIIEAYEPERIFLFGSMARGEKAQTSDVDLLVELEPKTFDAYMDVKLFLERLLGHSVDLVLADAVKPRLRPTILAEAVHAAGL